MRRFALFPARVLITSKQEPGRAAGKVKAMWETLIQLILFAVVFVLIPITGWEAIKRYREHKLRMNPPKKAVFELMLPRDVDNSNTRMQEVWANVRSVFDPSDEDRKEGLGTVTFWFGFSRVGERQAQLRCFVYCDADRAEALKRTMRTAFSNYLLDVRKVPDDEDPRRLMMNEMINMRSTEQSAALPDMDEVMDEPQEK